MTTHFNPDAYVNGIFYEKQQQETKIAWIPIRHIGQRKTTPVFRIGKTQKKRNRFLPNIQERMDKRQ